MIKATGKVNGRDMLYVGLSFANLDKFRDAPLDTYIRIDGKELDLPFDVMIFSGKTEVQMKELLSGGFGPNTKVTIRGRPKP